MRNLSWMWLALLVLVGCGDQFTEEEEKALKDLVKDEVLSDAELEEEIVWEKDGKEMVLIPAGSFEMGDHFNEGENDEQPVHRVELDTFYMDVHEVTVGQFKRFLKQSGYKPEAVKAGWDINRLWNEVKKWSPTDEHPVVYVSWNDATAYAKWAGKRLPTEAEWEYAARGRLVGKRYPGGDEITHDDANWGNTVNGKDKWSKCSPVGSFEANGYGLFDVVGNVYEWCADWYAEDYYASSPATNPQGPDTGFYRVLRGGGWFNDASYLRVANRLYDLPRNDYSYYGFRCVSGSNYP